MIRLSVSRRQDRRLSEKSQTVGLVPPLLILESPPPLVPPPLRGGGKAGAESGGSLPNCTGESRGGGEPLRPSPQMTVADAHALARTLGAPVTIAAALLAHLTGRTPTQMLTYLETPLPARLWAHYSDLVTRAAVGEPLAYLTGECEFRDLTFTITPDVLVPRPETELLIDEAVAWAAGRSALRIADVGTGSGVIAISLAVHLPQAEVVATDLSRNALRVARENAARHGVLNRVHPVQADVLAGVAGPFNLIVANLPYVRAGELPTLNRWEPRLALDGGPDGLAPIRALLRQAPSRIGPDGLLLLEIGAEQGRMAQKAVREVFPGADISVLTDLAGLERVIRVQL